MPSGSTHKRATVLALPPTAVAAGFVAANYGASVGPMDGMLAAGVAGAGMLATLAVHPDLDLVETYIHHKVRANRLLFFWYAPWWPYGKLVPHRHWISHFPFIGTILRIAYLAIPTLFIMACAMTQKPEWNVVYEYNIPARLAMWFIFGMMVSDTLHYLMDKVSTSIKRMT